MLAPLSNPVTVTLLTESASGRDAYGNDVRVGAETPVEGCAWWPQATVEDDQGRTLVTTGRVLLLPDGTAVGPSDRVRFADGSVWRVQGDPQQHVSALTGAHGGVIVNLQRVTG